jgi:hypothetical protein
LCADLLALFSNSRVNDTTSRVNQTAVREFEWFVWIGCELWLFHQRTFPATLPVVLNTLRMSAINSSVDALGQISLASVASRCGSLAGDVVLPTPLDDVGPFASGPSRPGVDSGGGGLPAFGFA